MNTVAAWGNLIRKEWLESRDAMIAGLAGFWVCPALLELLGLAIDWHHETDPITWVFLVGAGWLYASIMGAHVVCRDWGKAEELFLLAQPVSPRSVVAAKWIVGAVLIAALFGIVISWETALVRWGAFGADYKLEWPAMITVICVMAVGYVLAFTAAVMSRQMLASTVVACLVMLIWMTAPLLSSALTRVGILLLSWEELRSSAFVWLISLSLSVVIVCAATSLLYATRERAFRLGNKQLAWGVGLVVLALFSAAMTEVGNSLRVRDQVEVFDSAIALTRMVQVNNRFFLITELWNRQKDSPMVAFRVADDGRIRDLQRAVLPYTPQPPGSDTVESLIGFAADEAGSIVVSCIRERPHPSRLWRSTVVVSFSRTTLAWPEGGQPEVVAQARLKLPVNQHLRYIGRRFDNEVGSLRYTYVVSTDSESTMYRKLYVFDWQDRPNPGPRYEITLPQYTSQVFASRRKLHVIETRGSIKRAATFDVNHPEALLDERNWSFQSVRDILPPNWAQEFDRPGGIDVHVDQHGDLAYVSDLLGLRVARQVRRGQWEVIGEVRVSPLAMLFRLDPEPRILDDSTLVERTDRGIITYDVSNPSRPRRTGFINAVLPRWWEGNPISATKRHLVLCEYNLITVLDRPTVAKVAGQ